ncbi:hypothetical protein ACGYLO_21725 [Sulfitobacter sp. 1A13353]|uniref:hypothetical protein n=1 Tax=Sulfitobacter sp. 1A13353 TaxID=3368568 RepID=UPI003746E69F
MIEVMGEKGSAEFRTAVKLANSFKDYWPGLAASKDELVKISANRKLSNYNVSDVDIVVAAKLGPSRYIVPKVVFKDHSGRRVAGAKIRVRSFIAAIEVKDHDADGVDISAGNVDVWYRDGWKSATAQNDAQKYALLTYLRDVTGNNPWVYRCLMLEGINALPKDRGRQMPEAATVASQFDVPTFLAAMLSENTIGRIGNEYTMSSGEPDLIDRVLSAGLFNSVTPSSLDRKRMDRIAARPQEARRLAQMLGRERIHLRGEGGTGKTVLLAQIAHEAFKAHGKRSLFLTYNHALAADIQRLLALMNVPSSSDAGGVDVRTVMSFAYSWLNRLGAIGALEELGFQDYEKKCEEVLGYFREGVLSDIDIERTKREHFEQFDYDAILVDEGQDWPQAEADLVATLYGGERIALADGVSQLVRGKSTNWRTAVAGRSREGHLSFNECLRMKANLSHFSNSVAHRAGLNWKVEPNSEAAGGRVIVTTTPFQDHTELHDQLLVRASKSGNEPVDFLYCVAPSEVTLNGNVKASRLGITFNEGGKQVWDGTDPLLRRDFPRSTKEHRIIQYDSCRGLEGWVVVLDFFDEIWELKYQEALARGIPPEKMVSEEQWAHERAWIWSMIPLTRPIDTLVITLRNAESAAGKLILSVAEGMQDVVEVSEKNGS